MIEFEKIILISQIKTHLKVQTKNFFKKILLISQIWITHQKEKFHKCVHLMIILKIFEEKELIMFSNNNGKIRKQKLNLISNQVYGKKI